MPDTPNFHERVYAWRCRPTSKREQETEFLRERIVSIYDEHKGMIGSPILTAELRAEKSFQNISQQRVARRMKRLGLSCRYAKKFVPTTDSAHAEPVAPNLLAVISLYALQMCHGAPILHTSR